MKTDIALRIDIPVGESYDMAAECPDCLALVRKSKLDEHQKRVHE